MTSKQSIEKFEVEQIPEVQAYVDEQTALYRFMDQHKDVFLQFALLGEKHNNALERADKKMRELCAANETGVSCGPFVFKHFATKYNVEKLYNIVGRERFLEFGGTVPHVPTPQLDKKQIEILIAQNAITKDLRDLFVNNVPNYEKPQKVGMP